MSFFDMGPDSGRGRVSPLIWMYVVVTAGFTGVTISVWYFWTRVEQEKRSSKREDDVEAQDPPNTDPLAAIPLIAIPRLEKKSATV